MGGPQSVRGWIPTSVLVGLSSPKGCPDAGGQGENGGRGGQTPPVGFAGLCALTGTGRRRHRHLARSQPRAWQWAGHERAGWWAAGILYRLPLPARSMSLAQIH